MEANLLIRHLLYQIYHARIMVHSFAHKKKGKELHEFRIALRQTRSLSKLFLDDAVPFPEPLKAALKATNPIRELDVLIATFSSSEYPKLLKQLSKIRKNTLKTLFTPKFLRQTSLLLDEYYDRVSQIDLHFIPEILVQKVLTHYQHCINTYNSLGKDEKPKTLHRLRICFKDARYGFEFLEFSDIHKSQKIIQHCKQMQATLGAVQDGLNQVEWLEKLYESHPSSALKELLQKQTKALKKLKDTTLSDRSPVT
jgi:CHAD domain-containing protein